MTNVEKYLSSTEVSLRRTQAQIISLVIMREYPITTLGKASRCKNA